MCSRNELSVASSNEDGCSKGEQSNNGDKNCQAEENSIMWPVKPKTEMQSKEPAMLIQYKMTKKSEKSNKVPQEDDKNCQFTMKNVLTRKVKLTKNVK